MKNIVLLAVLLGLAAVAFASPAEEGEQRLQRLLSESRKTPLRSLTDSEFVQFVQDAPRPYSLIVLLTQSGGGCRLCGEIQPEVRLCAQAFENARYEGNASYPTGKPRHTVFFVRLDAARYFELFQKMGMTTIPHLIYVPPTTNTKRLKWTSLLHDKLGIYMGYSAENLVKLVNSRVHLDFQINVERPPEPLDLTPAILLILSVGSAAAFFLTIGRPLIDQYLRNPFLYFIASVLFYAYCAGGSMYNVLRETPWMHTDQKGQVSYIYPGSHNQFGAESYIIGFLYLACGFFGILLNTRALTMKTSSATRHLLIVVFFALFHLFYRQLRAIYTRKNPSYNMGFVWDASDMLWE